MLLRPGLLDGVAVLAAPRTTATAACAAYGARVLEAGPADVLVVDTAPLFGAGGPDALRAVLDGAWAAVSAARAAKIVLVAPRPAAGPHAEPARAGLENLARTLSVEWARTGVRTTAVLPGDAVPDAEVSEFVAYLASRAGDWFSGCRFDSR